MSTISIEVALSNADYAEGFSECCEAVDDAKRDFVLWLNIELEDLRLPMLSAEQCRGMAIRPVSEPSFIEADSTRRHGSCYFSVDIQVPEYLFAKMVEARAARNHTGD